MTEVSILLTLYNKENEVIEIIAEIQKLFDQHSITSYEIILCDDGSKDATRTKALQYASNHSNIHCVYYDDNKGRGFAVRKAYQHSQGRKIIYLDSDFHQSSKMTHIIQMIKALDLHKAAIGNRFSKQTLSKRKPLRNFIGLTYRLLKKIFFPDIQVTDTEVGFKGFQKEVFESCLFQTQENHWSFDLELIVLLHNKKIHCHEIPIEWNECHKRFKSSVHLFKDSIDQFSGFFRIKQRHHL